MLYLLYIYIHVFNDHKQLVFYDYQARHAHTQLQAHLNVIFTKIRRMRLFVLGIVMY